MIDADPLGANRTSTSTALTRDVTPRALQRLGGRKAMQRNAHDVALAVTKGGVAGESHPQWWYDLRRMRLSPYGSLLRFFDRACIRVPKSVLLGMVRWLHWYVDDLYEQDRSR